MSDLLCMDATIGAAPPRSPGSGTREGASPGGRPGTGSTATAEARAPEGGYALLVALLALSALGVLAVLGWMAAGIEARTSRAHRAGVTALYAAQSALAERLADPEGLGAGRREFSYPDAAAEVTITRLLETGEVRVLSVGATGTAPIPGGGEAVRRTGVILRAAGPRPTAALTVAGPLELRSADRISGLDAAGAAGCEGAPAHRAGVRVPSGRYAADPAAEPEGLPAVREAGSAIATAGDAGLDWAGLLAETEAGLGQAADPDAWPETDSWPLIRVGADPAELDSRHSGRGTLLLPGDGVLEDGFEWRGFLLVGGSLTIAGESRVEGAVLAGLDVLLGGEERTTVVDHGSAILQRNSCHVRSAVRRWLTPTRVAGSWYEAM